MASRSYEGSHIYRLVRESRDGPQADLVDFTLELDVETIRLLQERFGDSWKEAAAMILKDADLDRSE
jgi:ABC-type sulfate transport system substrate-binding protein